MRPVLFVVGWCFFGLGAVGAFLPGLPTVPLMLVALWAFSKSSPRFHDWLYSHRIFGPPLQQWQAHRVIPVKAKVLAVATMAASAVYMGFFSDLETWVMWVAGTVMLIGAAVILSTPSRVPD